MNIYRISESEKRYNSMKKALDVCELNGKAISNNIANINTKGYKRLYVPFQEAYNNSKQALELYNTKDKHIQIANHNEIQIKRDESTSIREDGNNVDVDIEMSNLAANTLRYNALIRQINSMFSLKKTIISGGR